MENISKDNSGGISWDVMCVCVCVDESSGNLRWDVDLVLVIHR